MKKTVEMNGKPLEIDTEARIIILESDENEKSALMYMPGLNDLIMIPVEGSGWRWNKDIYSPTFSPSILTHIERGESKTIIKNHVFVKEGEVQFLSDCSHEMAGQTVTLPKLSEWPAEMVLWDDEQPESAE